MLQSHTNLHNKFTISEKGLKAIKKLQEEILKKKSSQKMKDIIRDEDFELPPNVIVNVKNHKNKTENSPRKESIKINKKALSIHSNSPTKARSRRASILQPGIESLRMSNTFSRRLNSPKRGQTQTGLSKFSTEQNNPAKHKKSMDLTNPPSAHFHFSQQWTPKKKPMMSQFG